MVCGLKRLFCWAWSSLKRLFAKGRTFSRDFNRKSLMRQKCTSLFWWDLARICDICSKRLFWLCAEHLRETLQLCVELIEETFPIWLHPQISRDLIPEMLDFNNLHKASYLPLIFQANSCCLDPTVITVTICRILNHFERNEHENISASFSICAVCG